MKPTIRFTKECRTIDAKTVDATNYKDMCENFNCYEILPDDRAIKPYFDIEIKPRHCKPDQVYVDRWIDILNLATIELLKHFSNAKITTLNGSSESYICCKTSEETWIISLHIIVSNYIATKSQMLSIVNLMNTSLSNTLIDTVGQYFEIEDVASFKLFDDSVYDANRKMRSAFANKTHYNGSTVVVEERPLEIIQGEFEETVISSFFVENPLQLEMQPVATTVAPIVVQPTTDAMNSENELFVKMAIENGFLRNHTDRKEWIQMGCALHHSVGGNNGLALFDYYSQQYPKYYDRSGVIKTWESLKDINYAQKKPTTIATIHKWCKDEDLPKYKQIVAQVKQEIKTIEVEKIKETYQIVENDNEACDIIMESLKDTLIYVNGQYYYKHQYCWINEKKRIDSMLLVVIVESNLYKLSATGNRQAYSQNAKTAENIMKLVYAKIRVHNSNKISYQLFHTTTKKKLCFLDGVLDFKKRTFTLWEDYTEPIYTTIIIQRKYAEYHKNPNQEFIAKIKNDIIGNLFGDQSKLALEFFSRSIAGCNEDKNFMSYSGNRNCGKGILYGTMKNAFEDYVSGFNLENMLCKRESNKSSDLAKENAWLLDLEFTRVGIAQETEENENDNIKEKLKISNKVMKSVMSGGDELQARRLYQDAVKFTIDTTLAIFGNNELAISGEDSAQHHLKFAGVKQFIPQSKYDAYSEMGEAFLSSYAVRDEELKTKISTDDYKNAMVYLLYSNYSDKCIAVNNIADDEDEPQLVSIRSLIFKHYTITGNDKDKIEKESLFTLIGKDKKKILAELKQLNCIGNDNCKMRIQYEEAPGEMKEKQVRAFKGLILKEL